MRATAASRNRVAIFVVVGALTGIAPLSIDAYIPGLPELTSDLGTSASTGQLTLTAFLLGLALSQVVAGSISDNVGRRTPVLAGLIAYVVSSLLCGLSPGIWTLTFLRLVQGAAAGVGFVIARAIVRDLYTGSAGARMFARLVLISGVAPVVAPIIGGQVLRFTSWRGLFVVFAVISAMILVVANLVLVETLPEHLRHEPGVRIDSASFAACSVTGPSFPIRWSGALASPRCSATSPGPRSCWRTSTASLRRNSAWPSPPTQQVWSRSRRSADASWSGSARACCCVPAR